MTTTTADPNDIPDQPRAGGSTWYEVLDLTPKATQADVLRAYERALDLVEGRTIGGYFLLDPVAVDSARSDIEWAFLVLGDAKERAAYDARLGNAPTLLPQPSAPPSSVPPSTPPLEVSATPPTQAPVLTLVTTPPNTETPPTTTPPTTTSLKPKPAGLKFLSPVDDRKPAITFAPPLTDPAVRVPVTAEPAPAEPALVATPTVLPQAVMPPPIVPPIVPPSTSPSTTSSASLPVLVTPGPSPGLFALEGEVNGQLIKRIREARGLTLEGMVEATKIRKPYLSAIEEQDFENLPARVYLRGFLMTIGRVLKVDKVKLAEGYLAFVTRFGK
ncbi:MAG: helix-turn-helix transcriptional regulator [Deltaproteobacteria bacterium]|nr:helix-turn-helix transcriptional regulator [Deltaproteobacteria bacterium]